MESGEIPGKSLADMSTKQKMTSRNHFLRVAGVSSVSLALAGLLEACSQSEEEFFEQQVREEEKRQLENPNEKERLEALLPKYAKTNALKLVARGNETRVGTAFAFDQRVTPAGKHITSLITSGHLIEENKNGLGFEAKMLEISQPQFDFNTIVKSKYSEFEFLYFHSSLNPDFEVVVLESEGENQILPYFDENVLIMGDLPSIDSPMLSYSFAKGLHDMPAITMTHKVVDGTYKDRPKLKLLDGVSSGQVSGAPYFDLYTGKLVFVHVGRMLVGDKYIGATPICGDLVRVVEGAPDLPKGSFTVNQLLKTDIRIDDMIQEP